MSRIVVVFLALTAVLAPSTASAYHHAQLGRFVSRDPANAVRSIDRAGLGVTEDPPSSFAPGYVDSPNLYLCSLASPTDLVDPTGLDVWIETTTSAFGYHKRICVTKRDENCTAIGKYCVSVEGKGESGFHEDMDRDAQYITRFFPSDCESDRKFEQDLRDEVKYGTFDYKLRGNNCRTWAQQKFEQFWRIDHPDTAAPPGMNTPPSACELLWNATKDEWTPLPLGFECDRISEAPLSRWGSIRTGPTLRKRPDNKKHKGYPLFYHGAV